MGDSNRDAFYQSLRLQTPSGDSNDAPGIERDSLFLTGPSLLSRGHPRYREG